MVNYLSYMANLAVDPTAWLALVTLIAMEIVLGIDNLIFISIFTNKLPQSMRSRCRKIGLSFALIMRISLLGTIALIIQLRDPVISLMGHGFSWRDFILIAGGLFLVWKATTEIHQTVEPSDKKSILVNLSAAMSMGVVIGQILLLDLVFSVDSIITAVGMTEHVPIMSIAVIVAIMAMLFAADPLGDFIHRNPTIVMLALGFLLMIGTTLIAEGFGVPVAKGYIYSAMAFSAFVESLNSLARRRRVKAEIAKAAVEPQTDRIRP